MHMYMYEYIHAKQISTSTARHRLPLGEIGIFLRDSAIEMGLEPKLKLGTRVFYVYIYIYIYIYTRVLRALRARIGPWALEAPSLAPL